MDIQNLGIGSPFYVLRKGEKPVLETGVVNAGYADAAGD